MRKILIFAGTTEGRMLSGELSDAKIEHDVSVATDYGALLMPDNDYAKVYRGRMTADEMTEFIADHGIEIIVDATHPYAAIVTENIKKSAEKLSCTYMRLLRETKSDIAGEHIRFFENDASCIRALEETEGNILLTTGSKNLAVYCRSEALRQRLYARVLPGSESIGLCEAAGLTGRQIIAMQGPFSAELNTAIIRQFHISCMVTKLGGIPGGYPEKIEAAMANHIPVYVIGAPEEQSGESFYEICGQLEALCGIQFPKETRLNITLAGAGSGNIQHMTEETLHALEDANILMGARRLTEAYSSHMREALGVKALYKPDEIIDYLKECSQKYAYRPSINVVVLFSGDSGFYSGCKKLCEAVDSAIADHELSGSIKVLPGISSVAAMSALCHESWQDAAIRSIHGKSESEWRPILADTIRHESKTYVLVSGAEDVRQLGQYLIDENLENCEVLAGYQLSYPEEKLYRMTPGECQNIEEPGLYICLIMNHAPADRLLTHGVNDIAFIRDKVPMTKEEIRTVILSKLRLHSGSVFYDIGSGTGSIAIEAALREGAMPVYAIEKKSLALELMKKNRESFHVWNMHIISGEAPKALEGLEVPTHAFIGGSSGNLMDILRCLYHKNNAMRIVMTAVSVETMAEMANIRDCFPLANEEMVQIQISRSREAGKYRLMEAQNPVMLYAFDFLPGENRLSDSERISKGGNRDGC